MAAKLIKVMAGTTTKQFTKIVPADTKVSAFLVENNISVSGATLQLDGERISDYENKSFADFTSAEECTLFSVVNAKNA